MTRKIIPCLDMMNGRVVKGVNFINIVEIDDPAEAALRYCEEGADELVLLDINATHEGRKTMIDVVERVAKKVTVPFVVGGGIGDVEWIGEILKAGADKVSLNSAVVKRPELINEAAKAFGSERIVIAIDCVAKEDKPGWEVIISGGRIRTGLDIVEWAKECEKRGAGEILLTSQDHDGVKEGYDIAATRAVADAVKIPVTASGGAGKLEDFLDAFENGHAQGALAASLFHFRELTIPQVKEYLRANGAI